jgi:Tfp pilus assembly protein PilN
MALREINLISSDILSSRYLRRHLSFWALWLILSLSLLGSFFYYQTHIVLDKKRPITKLEDVHALIGTKIEDINRIQAELERLDQQEGVLKTIKRTRPYSSVLFKLSNIMNENTWLTSLTIDSNADRDKGENDNLELTGFAFSNNKLGNFLSMLSNDDLFKDVVLKYAKEAHNAQTYPDSEANTSLIQFQITCKMYENVQ